MNKSKFKHKNNYKSVGADDPVCPKPQSNTQKGITLIALVITIIILLILAMVSIKLVMNSGIISKAEQGVGAYSEEEIKEKIQLAYADYKMAQAENASYTMQEAIDNTGLEGAIVEETRDGWKIMVPTQYGKKVYTLSDDGKNLESTGTPWIDNGNDTYSKEGNTVKLGDVVNYNELTGEVVSYSQEPEYVAEVKAEDSGADSKQEIPVENLNWRVLGVNDFGELELISETPTTSTLTLKGENGYFNGESILNKVCDELYGNGIGSAGARALNMEDIVKLGDFSIIPETTYKLYAMRRIFRC